MLNQPYAENAMKHGLLHRKGENRLDISIEKEKDVLKITIDDNGAGAPSCCRTAEEPPPSVRHRCHLIAGRAAELGTGKTHQS